MQKKMQAGNWKMHKTLEEGQSFVQELKKQGMQNYTDREILLCVPFTMLASLAKLAQGSPIQIGAQDMYYETQGAFTGEISPLMLKDAGASHVLIGHSERRSLFHEEDAWIAKKMQAALAADLIPILCVGESLEQRETNQLEATLRIQLMGAYARLSKIEAAKTMIAYEPVWAIGTGKSASPQDADSAHAQVREILAGIYDPELADNMRILYGGSVKPENVDALMAMPHINGSLVGGASLQVESFARIVQYQA